MDTHYNNYYNCPTHFRSRLQVLQAKSPVRTILPLSVDKELTSVEFALEVLKVLNPLLLMYLYVYVCVYVIM